MLKTTVLLIGILILEPASWASPAASSAEKLDSATLRAKVEPKASAKWLENSSLELKLLQNTFIRSDQEFFRDGAEADSTDFHLRARGDLEPLQTRFDLGGFYSTGEGRAYVQPYELYYYSKDRERGYEIGRVKKVWSRSEDQWYQGLWQPRFLETRFPDEKAGLVGVFKSFKGESSRGFLWLSPLHIPEMGGAHEVNQGRFLSKNPWFRPPPARINFNGSLTEVEYSLNRPDEMNVVARPGAGFQWQTSSPLLDRLSYAYKPIPGFLYGFPYSLRQAETEADTRLEVDIYPRLLYHHLATWETRFETGWGSFGSSLTYEAPQRDKTPSTWITQETEEAWLGSVYWQIPVGRGAVELGALQLWGGDLPAQGELAPENSLFDRRFDYSRAVKLGLKSGDWNWGRWISRFGSDVIYDFDQRGIVWLNEFNLQASESFSFQLRADLLGLTSSNPLVQDGFIDYYRANDRVQAGMSYVF